MLVLHQNIAHFDSNSAKNHNFSWQTKKKIGKFSPNRLCRSYFSQILLVRENTSIDTGTGNAVMVLVVKLCLLEFFYGELGSLCRGAPSNFKGGGGSKKKPRSCTQEWIQKILVRGMKF